MNDNHLSYHYNSRKHEIFDSIRYLSEPLYHDIEFENWLIDQMEGHKYDTRP